MEDAIQQFRITTWPGGTLPNPVVHPDFTVALSSDGVLAPAVGAPLMFHDVPDLEVVPLLRAEPTTRKRFDRTDADDVVAVGEIYLELAGLDLVDAQAILRFVQRFGVLGVAF